MYSTDRFEGLIGCVQRQVGWPVSGSVMVAEAMTSGKWTTRGTGRSA
jgi:hypothetical protein